MSKQAMSEQARELTSNEIEAVSGGDGTGLFGGGTARGGGTMGTGT